MWAAAIILCGAVADFVRPLRTHRVGADGHPVNVDGRGRPKRCFGVMCLLLVIPVRVDGHLTLHDSTRTSHVIAFEPVLPA